MASKLTNKFLNACWQKAASYKFTAEEVEEAKRVLHALKDGEGAGAIVETTQHSIIKCLWGECVKEVQKCA